MRGLKADALAGLLGAVLVLPQGIAFARLAGLPPEYGLYSAVVPCIVAALAGSSRHVVSGPTNANSLALYAMLVPLAAAGSEAYIQLALAVTVLVGALQLATGLLRLGAVASFVSPPALLGFTTGAALLIGIHALEDALGLALPARSGTIDVLKAAITHPPQLAAGAVVLVTLIALLGLRRWKPRSPFMVVGLSAGSLASYGLTHWHGTAGLKVLGALPSALPPFHVPRVDPARLPELLGIAAALTIVALAQALAIAKAVAARSGQRIDANREFVGQGLANLLGGFFSSYVSCGSLNRSMPNFEAGAQSRWAAVTSALLVVPLVALVSPLLAHISFAAIAALLLYVAYTLVDTRAWRRLRGASTSEFTVAALTCTATLTTRLEIAILIGSALSLGLYLGHTSRPVIHRLESKPAGGDPSSPRLDIVRIEGSIYFGATAHAADMLASIRTTAPVRSRLLVLAAGMNFIDTAGADLWRQELRARRAEGGDVYFHGASARVMALWRRDGFLAELGEGHVFQHEHEALAAASRPNAGGIAMAPIDSA